MRFALALIAALVFLPSAARADSISVIGNLDPNNPNDVYLATFVVNSSSVVVIQSYGYGGSTNAPGGTNAAGTVIAPGGFDTYFSLFSGTGASANFVSSNDDGGCNPAAPVNAYCEDSSISQQLAPGAYTLALTLPNNFSIAENYGNGDLGDGFIGLQGSYYDGNSGEIRSSNFAFDIAGDGITNSGGGAPPPATPEPSSLALLATGFVSILTITRRSHFAR